MREEVCEGGGRGEAVAGGAVARLLPRSRRADASAATPPPPGAEGEGEECGTVRRGEGAAVAAWRASAGGAGVGRWEGGGGLDAEATR